MNSSEAVTRSIKQLTQVATVVAVIGVVASIGLFLVDSVGFAHAYLYGWVFWLTATLGCFGITLLHHSCRTHWGRPIIRLLEAGGGAPSLIAMCILSIPIFMNAQWLYPWAQPDHVKVSEVLKYRHEYMNLPFVEIRTVIYFAVWALFAFGLRYWSVQQDRTNNVALQEYRSNVAAGGLVLYFLTMMVAFTDWVMSLDIEWASTIYGIWFITCSGLLALSIVTIIMVSWGKHEPFAEAISITPRKFWRDITDLVLTLVMVWAYVSLSQFLIIWSGDLPAEVGYYVVRGTGGWRFLSWVVVVGQFFLPFLWLLAPRTKRPGLLRLVCFWIVGMRVLDMFWGIVPAYVTDQGNNFEVTAQFIGECAVALAAFGGVWFSIFGRVLQKADVVPVHIIPVMDEEAPQHA
jgi:hypothetical protein